MQCAVLPGCKCAAPIAASPLQSIGMPFCESAVHSCPCPQLISVLWDGDSRRLPLQHAWVGCCLHLFPLLQWRHGPVLMLWARVGEHTRCRRRHAGGICGLPLPERALPAWALPRLSLGRTVQGREGRQCAPPIARPKVEPRPCPLQTFLATSATIWAASQTSASLHFSRSVRVHLVDAIRERRPAAPFSLPLACPTHSLQQSS